MRIPLIKADLPAFEDVADSFRAMLETGRITNFGPHVLEFERELEAYLGIPAATVTNGTTGLVMALQAAGVKSGDEVIVPSFTFVASVQAIIYAGAVPVFAEVSEDLTVDPDDVAMLLAAHPRTAAVMPVHTFGLPARVDEIQALVAAASQATGRTIPVLYDAAHAFGSRLGNRKVGTFGTAEIFSLSVTKVLVSVEGGVVTSADEGFIQRLRKARNYGIESDYNAHWPGVNGKMSEFHAAIGVSNLRRVDTLMEARGRLAEYYLEQVTASTVFTPVPGRAGVTHTYKDFTVLMPREHVADRDRVIAFMDGLEIECRKYFAPPTHRQAYFQKFADRPLPITDDGAARVITLPFFTTMTHDEVDRVVSALADAELELGWR